MVGLLIVSLPQNKIKGVCLVTIERWGNVCQSQDDNITLEKTFVLLAKWHNLDVFVPFPSSLGTDDEHLYNAAVFLGELDEQRDGNECIKGTKLVLRGTIKQDRTWKTAKHEISGNGLQLTRSAWQFCLAISTCYCWTAHAQLWSFNDSLELSTEQRDIWDVSNFTGVMLTLCGQRNFVWFPLWCWLCNVFVKCL